MNFRQRYINVRTETGGETSEEKRTRERKRKIVNLAYWAEHRISLFRGNLILNISVLCFETWNFVRREQ